jgi:1,2-diacylglycerol 3-beta-galactosyltransferase
MTYKLSNTHNRARAYSRLMYMTMDNRLRQMIREHPADVYVSVHSILTRVTGHALSAQTMRPPFMVVVTDLVSTHMLWYDRRADRTLVPTTAAYERGLRAGILPEKMRNTGLPVNPRFMRNLPPKHEARETLGWDPHKPAILIVGGGEGMGPLYETARAINARRLDCQIAVIAGKNAALKAQLEASEWNQPTHIYGFVTDMPRVMAASDIIATKAGPSTICEAAIAGVPVILYDFIPGQEDGNVSHVVDNHAGVFAPTSEEVAAAVDSWLANGGALLREYAAGARAIARPNAVYEIAEEVWAKAQQPPVPNRRLSLLSTAQLKERLSFKDWL